MGFPDCATRAKKNSNSRTFTGLGQIKKNKKPGSKNPASTITGNVSRSNVEKFRKASHGVGEDYDKIISSFSVFVGHLQDATNKVKQ